MKINTQSELFINLHDVDGFQELMDKLVNYLNPGMIARFNDYFETFKKSYNLLVEVEESLGLGDEMSNNLLGVFHQKVFKEWFDLTEEEVLLIMQGSSSDDEKTDVIQRLEDFCKLFEV